MSTFTDSLWSSALAEAYTHAPTDEVILHTLELRHPSFLVSSAPAAIRVVRDIGGDLLTPGDPDVYGQRLKLEAGAPYDSNQYVDFVACMFDFSLPGQSEGSLPEVEISLDNVTQEISNYLDSAIGTRAPLELTYREYLASNKSQPQFILSGLTLSRVHSTIFRVTGTASFVDLLNSSFPKKLYRPSEFQGLVQT